MNNSTIINFYKNRSEGINKESKSIKVDSNQKDCIDKTKTNTKTNHKTKSTHSKNKSTYDTTISTHNKRTGRPKGAQDKLPRKSTRARSLAQQSSKRSARSTIPKNQIPSFNVPDYIHSKSPKQSTYSKAAALAILTEVAITDIAVSDICTKYGFPHRTFFSWLVDSEELSAEYIRALENRCHVEAASAQEALQELENYIKEPDIDPREKHVRTNFMRIKLGHLQWRLERHNRRLYGQQVQIDANVTVSAGEARNKAWEILQSAENVPYVPVNE